MVAMGLRFLVVEGNTRESREAHRAGYGMTPSESYSSVLQSLTPELVCDIALPADEGANLPDPAGLEAYDGIFLTGSALHAYQVEPAVTRQVELARAAFKSRTPLFGSCWGIQMGALAAGGDVIANPVGREVGIARKITPSEAGRSHPLLAGRAEAFDAPAIHLDIVSNLPGDVTVLASNAYAPVQAAEIRHDGGVMWGVQYHPEYSLREISVILGRRAPLLIGEGLFADQEAHARHIADLRELHDNPHRRDLAWRLGLDEDILVPERRLTELRNFIAHRVLPERSARGRA
jgi:GMP synthase (glutamine-hydrolysing)